MKKRMLIRDLLALSVLTLVMLSVILVLGCLVLVNHLQEMTDWTNHSLQIQLTLGTLRAELRAYEAQERGYLLSQKEEFLEDYDDGQRARDSLRELRHLVADSPDQLQRVSELSDLMERRLHLLGDVLELARKGEFFAATNLDNTGTGKDSTKNIMRLIGQMEDNETGLLTQRRASLEWAQRTLPWLLTAGLILGLLVGGAFVNHLSARLLPLDACVVLAEQIGRGDLSSEPIPMRVADEVGRLTHTLNETLMNLRKLTLNTRGYGERLGAATQQILAVALQQSASGQQQATAVSETSSTIEGLGLSAAQIADRARELVTRAEATSKSSESGLKAVEENVQLTDVTLRHVRSVAERILALNEKTRTIGSIVSNLNELSERSNVLALNTAILAASSAEGKSFAVVAQEMKSLSQQSKEATLQVRALLEEIERGIQGSVLLADEAVKVGEAGSSFSSHVKQTIGELDDNIQENLQAFQLVMAATHQQRLAYEHVAKALASIRQAVDQNSQGTRQFESSAQELTSLSQALQESIRRYRLREDDQEP